MDMKTKRRSVIENGDTGDDMVLANLIVNGDDAAPLVRHAFEIGRPEGLLNQLNYVVKKKGNEIEELCKSNYDDFILAVDELRGVLLDAEGLKGELLSDNSKLHHLGSALLENLEGLLDSYEIKKNVTEAIKLSKYCVQVLDLCVNCNKYISEGQFYPALKILDLLEENFLKNIPVKNLKKVIEKRIPVIKLHIEKVVCNQVNEWLAEIRSSSKDIGLTAISRAIAARQRDDEMLQQQRKAEELSISGVGDLAYTLDIEEFDDDSVLLFDLTPLYRAGHIHDCLRISEKFRQYYYNNRVLQLKTDLEVSSTQPFVEYYQTFFAQIAGYFMMEDRVLRTANGLLVADQVEKMWGIAIEKITSLLDEQFSHMDSAAHILLVKDHVSLLAFTLRQYKYDVRPLLEALDNNCDKYHACLLEECRRQIVDVLGNDVYKQMVIKKGADYENNVLSFNLQTSDILPDFPYVAPFSSMVPDTCRIVRSFVKGSVDYLSHGVHINFYDIVRKYLDKFLIDGLNKIILDTINNNCNSVSQAMQIAANISVLERACDFFLQHAAQLCGLPIKSVEKHRATLYAKAELKTLRDKAHAALLTLVNKNIDEFMAITENVDWTTDEIRQHGNNYMNEVIYYLDSVMSTAQQILPLDAVFAVGVSAFKHISNSIVAAFLSDSVKRFNANALIGIDNDLLTLENFADERFRDIGLGELNKEGDFKSCLVEARQLINLLLSNQPKDFMDPALREENYYALDDKKVAAICDKFKDAPDGIFESLANKSAKLNIRKKSMDMLKKAW